MSPYFYLAIAIGFEVIATSALKASNGFTHVAWSSVVVVGYGVAFYSLSLALKGVPLGVAYGLWSAIGIVLVSIAGWLLYQQRLDWPAIVGLMLIVAGVLVINLLSKSTHLAST
jgi:small multidrug resistance pump